VRTTSAASSTSTPLATNASAHASTSASRWLNRRALRVAYLWKLRHTNHKFSPSKKMISCYIATLTSALKKCKAGISVEVKVFERRSIEES